MVSLMDKYFVSLSARWLACSDVSSYADTLTHKLLVEEVINHPDSLKKLLFKHT